MDNIWNVSAIYGLNMEHILSQYTLQDFKVAFSTYWFKFDAILRRQAER